MGNILFLIFFPIIISIVIYLTNFKKRFFLVICQGLLIINGVIIFINNLQHNSNIYYIGNWDNGTGIPLYIDSIASSMILLCSILFMVFVIYDMTNLTKSTLYLFFIYTLQGLLYALIVAHDLFNIFVLLELSTLLVSILIVYKKYAESYYDSFTYLLTNIVGMSFFLLGTAYIYRIYGVYDLTTLGEYIKIVETDTSIILAYSLLLTGISFKIGVIPVFTWLPRAHGSKSSPTIVSATLSGIFINIGFLYFIKLQNIFSPLFSINELFIWIGFFTALVGGLLALLQNDIKKLLGYSTVSQIGLIMMGLNMGSDAFYGSIYHIFSHSLFKILLFLTAGLLIKEYKTRDLNKIRGILKSRPIIGVSLIFGLLGISGAPFFNGSIGKYILAKNADYWYFDILFYLLSFITILYLMKIFFMLFGESTLKKKQVHIPEQLVLVFLALCCLIGGIFSEKIIELVFGYNLNISMISYLTKGLIYVVFLGICFFLHKNILSKYNFEKDLKALDIPFNIIASMIFLLFITITIYLNFAYLG